MRHVILAAMTALSFALSGCNQQQPAANDEMKKDLDQLVQGSKDIGQSAKDIANATKASAADIKALAARIESLEKSLSGELAKQKRGAIYLTLDADAACDNDEQCVNTARAVCNRINYPNGLTSKVNPGVRPTLHSLVCYD
jgi:PBP1b-binding outer membrane lipoprotein LpoB